MAKELKTGWVCIATSGSVVHGEEDGRFIKKEWLEDMAKNYNVKVNTASLWAEHERYFGSFGKVLALKVEPATEESLKGELQLFAIIAPNNSLIRANQEGRFCFPSIEVGENYRGTGEFFLKGLGVTDEPASAGVTELKFSKGGNQEKLIVATGHQFNLAEEIQEEVTLLDRILGKTFNTKPEQPPMAEKNQGDKETPQTEAQQFMAQFSTMLGGALEKFAKDYGLTKAEEKPEGDKPEGKKAGDEPEETVSADKFNKLQEQFDKLQAQFNTLQNTPAGGTNVPESDGDGDAKECL